MLSSGKIEKFAIHRYAFVLSWLSHSVKCVMHYATPVHSIIHTRERCKLFVMTAVYLLSNIGNISGYIIKTQHAAQNQIVQ